MLQKIAGCLLLGSIHQPDEADFVISNRNINLICFISFNG